MRSFLYGLTSNLPRLIVASLATLAILVGVGTVKHKPATLPSKPLITVVDQWVMHPTNCPEDPLATPCTIVRVVVENRSFTSGTAILNCGDENDEAKVEVPARTRLTIDEELTVYTIDPKCSLK